MKKKILLGIFCLFAGVFSLAYADPNLYNFSCPDASREVVVKADYNGVNSTFFTAASLPTDGMPPDLYRWLYIANVPGDIQPDGPPSFQDVHLSRNNVECQYSVSVDKGVYNYPFSLQLVGNIRSYTYSIPGDNGKQIKATVNYYTDTVIRHS